MTELLMLAGLLGLALHACGIRLAAIVAAILFGTALLFAAVAYV